MLDLSIIEVTFTTMSPRIISSAAWLKACTFNLVIPKFRSSSILIFLVVLAHLALLSISPTTNSCQFGCPSLCFQRMVSGIQSFVLLTIYTLTLLILFLLKFLMKQTDRALKQDCRGLTLTLKRRCKFARWDWELSFLLSPGETIWRLSYNHSRILRRERDFILLFSCFKTRSRKSFLVVEQEKMKLTLV